VISAVEGVQPQTRILMRALDRLRVPTLLFVNKLDRRDADAERALQEIGDRLTPMAVPIDSAEDAAFARELAAEGGEASVYPVFLGSARTGDGVLELMTGIAELLPSAERDGEGTVSGSVFKIERGPAGEKVAFVRMFSGSLRVRDRVRFGRDGEAKVTAIGVFDGGSTARRRDCVSAGEIGKLWGLGEIQIGDAVGRARAGREHHFAPPTLETVVVPRSPADKGALSVALGQLSEQDPLIRLRQDDERQELSVSLYGEVQKEVIQATLAADYGLEVGFRETTTICVERPLGTGEAVERIRRAPNPFLATVGLRVEAAPVGTGVVYRRADDVPGTMPRAFFKAVEETVHEALRQGLNGWEVTDCVVTLTHTGYYPRQSHAHQGFNKAMSSTAGDFRNLTPLVLMGALKQAGTVVCEPIQRFRLDAPTAVLASLLAGLARLRAVPEPPLVEKGSCTIEGDIPAACVHELRQQLPALTLGEGVLECEFDRYEPVSGKPPARARTDDNPLDREAYLLRLSRRVGGR
jgi:ribosomal protection tetracycline resistance protein